MTISESIVLGIVTGVITSVFIAVLATLFNKIIIPWYRSIIYSGIDISGEWTSSFNTPNIKETASIIIKQKADKISGVMTISIHHSKDKTGIKNYEMKGELEDRLLSLRGRNIDNKHIGVDVALLEVINGGNTMLGYEAWFSTQNNRIDSEPVEWTRI